MAIDQDMFEELATAVYAGDLAKATEALNLMRASGSEHTAALLMRARQRTYPLPPSVAMDTPIPLPQAGKDPITVFGSSGHYDQPKPRRKSKKAA